MKFLLFILTASGLTIGFLLLLLGIIFKIMHWPDANVLFYGGLFLIVVFGVIKYYSKKHTT